jgi:hypothetical protein
VIVKSKNQPLFPPVLLGANAAAALISGLLGYASTAPSTQAAEPPEPALTAPKSPPGQLALRLVPEVLPSTDGDELTVTVHMENHTDATFETATATTLVDDRGEEWLPEAIVPGAELPGQDSVEQDVVVPAGLPDGYFRLEVTVGYREAEQQHPLTTLQNVYFAREEEKVVLMSAGDWLLRSGAMQAQDVSDEPGSEDGIEEDSQ